MIEPTYATFEQSKFFKEKGFNIPLSKVYNTLGELWDSHYQTMSNNDVDSGASCVAPEQWQVCEWLRVEKGIWVGVMPDIGMDLIYTYKIYSVEVGVERCLANGNNYDTPQAACSAAFDYIKNNNLI